MIRETIMVRKIIIFIVITLITAYYGSFCQIIDYKEFDPKKKDWELYITFSTTGGGMGGKVKWGDRENVQRFFSFEIGGVRGANEFTMMYYDPYYGYIPEKINQERYMILIPLYYGFQKRMLKDAIEDNFRPFLDLEAGPIFGARFPVGNGLFGNIKRGRTSMTLGGFLGAGIEVGDIRKDAYIFSVGYRVSYFFNKLDNERNFSAFVIRLGMLTQF
jgi:hypothetical protein